MLILTRQASQSVFIDPRPALDPSALVEELFAKGPIQIKVLEVRGKQVRLGVAAPTELNILREELRARAGANPLPEGAQGFLARNLKMLMFLNRHSTESLALAAGLVPAQVLGVKVSELFYPPGRTTAERWVLGLLEGKGYL